MGDANGCWDVLEYRVLVDELMGKGDISRAGFKWLSEINDWGFEGMLRGFWKGVRGMNSAFVGCWKERERGMGRVV